jgi:hypothetical protein
VGVKGVRRRQSGSVEVLQRKSVQRDFGVSLRLGVEEMRDVDEALSLVGIDSRRQARLSARPQFA